MALHKARFPQITFQSFIMLYITALYWLAATLDEQKLAKGYGDEIDTVDYSNISQVGIGTLSGRNANEALMSFKAPLPFSTESQEF